VHPLVVWRTESRLQVVCVEGNFLAIGHCFSQDMAKAKTSSASTNLVMEVRIV
jgi:hypothetical protein